MILDEFTEEISASVPESEIKVIISLFRGNHYAFERSDIETSLRKISEKDKDTKLILNRIGVDNLLRFLFRIVMIGNQFEIVENNVRNPRNIWAVRGYEPLLDKRFVLHQSVRRIIATV
ncbi:hypothetical protein G6L58_13480 [Agrobacterium tumefaciens]|uniref:hypothetical protein n=1 Tax=Agrobacterium tumefaciens TaxID=358 RepID=UPI000EF18026|nr:hypothetical protein [Agrobacterium tumefaciens]